MKPCPYDSVAAERWTKQFRLAEKTLGYKHDISIYAVEATHIQS